MCVMSTTFFRSAVKVCPPVFKRSNLSLGVLGALGVSVIIPYCTTAKSQKISGLLDAVAALGLGIHSCVVSYQRAVCRVLFDSDVFDRRHEFRTLVFIDDIDVHRDGQPLGRGALQLGFITCRNLKLDIFVLLEIQRLEKQKGRVL